MKKKRLLNTLGHIDHEKTALSTGEMLMPKLHNSKEDFNGSMEIEGERGITIVCANRHEPTAVKIAEVMAKDMNKSIAIVGADTLALADFSTKEARQLNTILQEDRKMDFEINRLDVGDYHVSMSGQDKRRMRRKNKRKK